MSSRVLGFVLIGVSLALLGSATAASAGWLYTQNWATADNEMPVGMRTTGGYQALTLPDYPFYYVANDKGSGTYPTDGFVVSVASNVMTEAIGTTSGDMAAVEVRASDILPLATPAKRGPLSTYRTGL